MAKISDEKLAKVIIDELHRAESMYPAFANHHEGYAVILEELDELWDCIKTNNYEQTAVEARQVSAMGMRFLKDLYEGS